METLVALSIVAIVVLLVHPNLHRRLAGIRTQLRAYSISSIINQGNNMAVVTASHVVLCPSRTLRDCTNQWNKVQWMMFIDANANKRREDDELLIRTLAPSRHTTQRFSIRSPRSLLWYPTGHINHAFSLTLCPVRAKGHQPRVLVVNLQSRVRHATGSNARNRKVSSRGESIKATQQPLCS